MLLLSCRLQWFLVRRIKGLLAFSLGLSPSCKNTYASHNDLLSPPTVKSDRSFCSAKYKRHVLTLMTCKKNDQANKLYKVSVPVESNQNIGKHSWWPRSHHTPLSNSSPCCLLFYPNLGAKCLSSLVVVLKTSHRASFCSSSWSCRGFLAKWPVSSKSEVNDAMTQLNLIIRASPRR